MTNRVAVTLRGPRGLRREKIENFGDHFDDFWSQIFDLLETGRDGWTAASFTLIDDPVFADRPFLVWRLGLPQLRRQKVSKRSPYHRRGEL